MAAKSKFDPKNMHALVSAERRRAINTYSLILLLPICPHHVVADIGCGPGYFTVPLAKFLHNGKVHALDVQQEMLDATQEALDETRLTNVKVTLSDETRLPLDDESLDGVLLAFVLQEADDPEALLAEAQRCLRRSGWLAVLEWYRRDMEEGPPVEQRIDPDEMQVMVDKLELKVRDRSELNHNQYMMLMRK